MSTAWPVDATASTMHRFTFARASGVLMCWYRFSTRLFDTIESPVAADVETWSKVKGLYR